MHVYTSDTTLHRHQNVYLHACLAPVLGHLARRDRANTISLSISQQLDSELELEFLATTQHCLALKRSPSVLLGSAIACDTPFHMSHILINGNIYIFPWTSGPC